MSNTTNSVDFSGAGVALVTPFSQGSIDFHALESLIEHVIKGGIDYLVCLGTTGEASSLSAMECRQVLRFTVGAAAGRVPVVAGFFGGNNTAQLVEMVGSYDFDGVAAIMSSSPAYNRPTQEGLFLHYMALQAASPLPVIIYNVPSRTASNVEADTVLRLAGASDKFVAVKEASGNLSQVMRLLKYRPEHLRVLSGDDLLTLPIMACGGDGAISVIANALPAAFAGMVHAVRQGNLPLAQELNASMLDVHPWLYTEGNPAGVKGALSLLGLCSSELRLPLTPLTEKSLAGLRQAMQAWL